MDIVVYDASEEPAIMAQTNQVLFPVENVRLCIEVKTTADKGEIEDAVAKRKSILRLNSRGAHPSFAFVGYQASQTAATIAKHLQSGSVEDRLDFACILQLGMFASKLEFAPGSPDESKDYIVGVTPLHNREGKDRISGSYMEPPEDGDPAASDILHDGNQYPIVDISGTDFVCEPSRALLLFCESMLNLLSVRGSRSVFSHYLTDVGREIKTL
ncbi:hypothetical protein FFI94_033020 [Rhodococcus sp. KBS0724]|nr:hypothetical protein FFI94_033020 [Rhodococcus sp. KBS0724]